MIEINIRTTYTVYTNYKSMKHENIQKTLTQNTLTVDTQTVTEQRAINTSIVQNTH